MAKQKRNQIDNLIDIASQTGVSRPVLESEIGTDIECSGTLTLTFPDTLSPGFWCTVTNVGTGEITFAATAIKNRYGFTKCAVQDGVMTVKHRLTTGDFSVTGDLDS